MEREEENEINLKEKKKEERLKNNEINRRHNVKVYK